MDDGPRDDTAQDGRDGITRRDALKTLGVASGFGSLATLPGEVNATEFAAEADFSTMNRTAYSVEAFDNFYGHIEEMINTGYNHETALWGPWNVTGFHQQQVAYEVESVDEGALYTFYVDSRMNAQATDTTGGYEPRDGVRYYSGPEEGELVTLADDENLTVPAPLINAQTFALRIEGENATVVDREVVEDDPEFDGKAVDYTRTHANGKWVLGPWTHSANPQDRINVYDAWSSTSPADIVTESLDFMKDKKKVGKVVDRLPDSVPAPDPKTVRWAGRAGSAGVLAARIVATYGKLASNCNAKQEFDSPEQFLKEIALDKASMVEGVVPYAGSTVEDALTELTGLPTVTEVVKRAIERQDVPDGPDYWFETDHEVVKSTSECALPAAGHTAKVTVKVPEGETDAIDIVSSFHLTKALGVAWRNESQRIYVHGDTPGDGCTVDCPTPGGDYEADPIPEMAVIGDTIVGNSVTLSAYPSQGWGADVDHSQTKWWVRQTNQDDGVRDGDAPPTGTGKEIEWTPGVTEPYTVRLQVTDGNGRTGEDTFQIVPSEPDPPVAMLEADRTSISGDGGTVSFDASRSIAPYGNIESFDWSFGDGSATADGGATIDHTYEGEGTYTATVTVTDTYGKSTSSNLDITIAEDAPPVARLTPDARTVQVDEATITFDASGSSAPEGTVDSYRFNFGDGTVVEGEGPSVTHTYEYVQEYEPAVTVTDSNGNTDVETSTITVTEDVEPNLDVDFTHEADSYVAGNEVSFVEDVTIGSNYEIDNYEWLIGPSQQCGGDAPGDGLGETYTHTFSDPGVYWVALRVYASSDDDLAADCWQYPFKIRSSDPSIVTPDDPTVNEIVTIAAEDPGEGNEGDFDRYRWTVTDPDGAVQRSGDFGESFLLPIDKQGNWTIDLRIENFVEEDNVSYPTTVYYEGATTLSVAADPNEGPTAVVDAPDLVEIGESAQLDGRNSADADGTITNYDWTVETAADEQTYSGHLVDAVSWSEPGTYQVSLTVTDDDGSSASAARSVTVDDNDGPIPDLQGPSEVSLGADVTYDATWSSDPDGSVTGYEWSITHDGSTESATGGTVTTTWNSVGEYTVSVDVTDDDGTTSTGTRTVTVVDPTQDPVVQSLTTTPETPTTADTVTAIADASDPDGGDVVAYDWDFGDGTSTTTQSGEAAHDYTSPGDYQLTCTVTDDEDQTATETTTVSVTRDTDDPVVSGMSFSPSQPRATESITISAQASDPDGGSVVEYAFDFGDGTSTTGTEDTVTHTYDSAGAYQIVVTVTDDEGETATAAQELAIDPAPEQPVVQAVDVSPTPANPGDSVGFTVDASDPDGGSVVAYDWDFGDGTSTTSSAASATHTYDSTGDYTVAVTVTDDEGQTATGTTTVSIVDEIVPVVEVTPENPVVDESVTFDASASTGPEALAYEWTIDGTTYTGASVTTTFGSAGDVDVSLTVSSAEQTAGTTTTVSVAAPNQAPTAAGSATVDGNSIILDASASTDPDGSIAEYRWALAGGYDYGERITVDERYVPRDRQVELRVTDDDGATDTTTLDAHAPETLPVPKIDLPWSAEQYDTVRLDATDSYDPDGEIVEYRWYPGLRRERTGETATVRFRMIGEQEVELEVTDDDGNTDTITETIWIRRWGSSPVDP